MKEGYSLSGAGFVFLVLELFFVMLSTGLVICTLRHSILPGAADIVDGGRQAQQSKSRAAEDLPPTSSVPPTLLAASGQSQKEGLEQDSKTTNVNAVEIQRDAVLEEACDPVGSKGLREISSQEAQEGSEEAGIEAQETSQEAAIEMLSPRDHRACV